MKKILFMIPSLGGGGAEKVLVNLVNDLDENKYNITIFALFDTDINKKYLNNDIEYIYLFKKVFRGNIHLFKLLTPRLLYKLIIKKEYDIAISYLEGPTSRIIAGCPYKDSKLINWVHTEIKNKKYLKKSYRSYDELIDSYNKFSKTIFVSESTKKAFTINLPEIRTKKEVIYNTLDYSGISSESNEQISDIMIDKNKVNLVSVGRYIHLKGYERLILIINQLVKEGKKIHLYLLGAGELKEDYTKLIKENNLENNITLLGFKNNPHKYVKNCDLFVCSSYSEGFSTAVSESLLVGTPVITTNCAGMEELLGRNNEYGIITENDEQDLLNELRIVIDDSSLLKKYKEKATIRGNQLRKRNNTQAVEKLLDSF